MRLTIVLLTAIFLQISTTGSAQKISITLKNAPLQKVFGELRKQTGYIFLYTNQMLEDAQKVDIDVKDASLQTVLDICFTAQPLIYTIVDKTIIVKPAKSTHSSSSPTLNIKGRITTQSGEPVIATILIKGSSNGTSSNADGFFELAGVESTATLFITGTSIEPQEVKLAGRNMLTITVKIKITEQQEVIIGTSYTSNTKSKSTSSIVKITAKEIENQPVTSPLLALQGRVAGLDIAPATGAPGGAPNIHIRGSNSLRFTGNNPLYIIDGIPIDSRPIFSYNSLNLGNGGYDPLININPSNIQSIEVLKDGDATAIYGSRGANGVIVIRTKINKKEQSTSVDFTAYTGMGKITHFLDMMDGPQYLAMRREAFKNDNITPTALNAPDLMEWDTTRNTDWQKTLLGGSSHISDVQINLSGSNGNTSFRLGGSYYKETTIFPGDFGYQRMNGQLSLNHSSSNKKFNASFIANYGVNNNKLFYDNLVFFSLTLPPVAPTLYTPAGELNWGLNSLGNSTFSNPLALLKKEGKAKQASLTANTLLSYELIPGLSLKANIGYTDFLSNEIVKSPLVSIEPQERASRKGSSNFSTAQRKSWIMEPQLQFLKNIGDHAFDVLLGTSFQQGRSTTQAIIATGYTSDGQLETLNGATKWTASDQEALYSYASVIARIGYNFQGKYLLNVTGRRDGSSRFGPGNRWGNFGSVGAGWIFSKEAFLQQQHIVNFGKLRGSYAITGNDQIGDYQYYNVYKNSLLNYQSGISLSPGALYNPNYHWEATKKLEAALELGLMQNKISLEINFYRNRSFDQLIEYQLPATTGFPSIFKNFEAVIENRGWEFMLSTSNFTKGKFRWTTSVNLTLPYNELIRFPNIETSSYSQTYKVGEPLSVQYFVKYQGVNRETGRYTFLDLDKDGKIDVFNDRLLGKNLDPKYYGGIMNTFQFYGVELAMLFQFSSRNAVSFSTGTPGSRVNQPRYIVDRWQYYGDYATYAKYSQSANASSDFSYLRNSDFRFVDASFIRLKTLTLSYTLPTAILSRWKLAQTRFTVQGQNLFTKTNYFNLDPETGASLPPLRTWTAGIQIKI